MTRKGNTVLAAALKRYGKKIQNIYKIALLKILLLKFLLRIQEIPLKKRVVRFL